MTFRVGWGKGTGEVKHPRQTEEQEGRSQSLRNGRVVLAQIVLLCNWKRHPERQPRAGKAAWQMEHGLDFTPTTPCLVPLYRRQPAQLYAVAQRPCKKASVTIIVVKEDV